MIDTLQIQSHVSKLIQKAFNSIRHQVIKTPVIREENLSRFVSRRLGSFSARQARPMPKINIYLKCENFQNTGSFKYRGVCHALTCMSDDELKMGLLTTSSGNHAKALIAVGKRIAREKGFDIEMTVVMPNNASEFKKRACEAAGGKIVLSGPSWAERDQTVKALQQSRGFALISSSENLNVILGQGTIAIEMKDQVKYDFGVELDCIVTPCGGGGLLAGTSLAMSGSGTAVFGAEPEQGADDCRKGLLLGQRLENVVTNTIADGLRCPVGKLPWRIISNENAVQDILTASEDEILSTMKMVWEHTGMVIEPSAAVSLAAVLFGEGFKAYSINSLHPLNVGVILTGGNCSRMSASYQKMHKF